MLSYGIANTFQDDEDNMYAFGQPNYLQHGLEKCRVQPEERCQPLQPVILTQCSTHENGDRKIACNMVKYFKQKSDRFSPKHGEDVHKHYLSYALTSNGYKLSPEQKLAFLHKRFEKEADITIITRLLLKENLMKMLEKTV